MSSLKLSPRSLAALAAAGVAAAALAPSASASSSWATTHTQALHLDGSLLRQAPASQPLEISVALPLRNQSRINSLIESRTILSAAQTRARFSPTTATVAAVERYLAGQGFTKLTVAPDRLLISGQATVGQAERAFNTRISDFSLNGSTVYANTAAAEVPAALRGKVTAVLGLSDVPMGLPKLRTAAAGLHASSPQAPAGAAASGSPDLTGFTPQAIQHAYQADGMPAASATETAIIAGGDMTSTIKDLRGAEKYFGFPQVPVNVIEDSPYAGQPDNPLSGNLEWALDTQYSTFMASTKDQTVKALDIYDIGTFTDSEVARGINMFVSDDRASALSISLGECDALAFLDGAMITSDELLAEGALQGQSSFSSTGDNGYACPEVASTGVPGGPPDDSWPAVGEYTVGAGGTTLLADSDGNVQEEASWIGGGGGVDTLEVAAPWTLQANPFGQSWQYTNQGGRAIPDASAVADSTTPVLVYTGGSTTGVGGTSVASPVIEGLWDRVNNTGGDRLGLAQFDFYDLYNKTNPATMGSALGTYYIPDPSPGPVTGFRDITLGTNGGCAALPGWDDCSGIGSPQAADMAKALASYATSPAAGRSTTTGSQGQQGPAGPQGPAGSQGPSGPQGPAGAQGPAGPAGAHGTSGSTGSSKSGAAKKHRAKHTTKHKKARHHRKATHRTHRHKRTKAAGRRHH